VQVKHRADPAQREDIAALRGVLKSEREVGLFVSTGGFTREARREARDGAAHIRLIDLDDFLALWVRHHDALPAAAREGLRLAPVYFLDAPSGASSAALTRISSSTQAVTSFSEVST
jgi:restriction system protein